jgi:hypothetical protein
MNKERLIRLKDLVRREARRGRFDMSTFMTLSADPEERDPDQEGYLQWKARRFEACGTAACLAGLTCASWHEEIDDVDGDVEDTACRILGLSWRQAERLFYVSNWPSPQSDLYYLARSQDDFEGMAEAACEVIDQFIERGER